MNNSTNHPKPFPPSPGIGSTNRFTMKTKDEMRRILLVLAAIILIGCQSLPPAYDVEVKVITCHRIQGNTWEVLVQQPGSILSHSIILSRDEGFKEGETTTISSHEFK